MNPNKIYLVQTDTTVGFLSKDKIKLNKIKKRPLNRPVLREVDSLKTLKNFVRVPKKHKNRIRRAKKTTFILPNTHSYRVIYDTPHLLLLNRLKWVYTTSANLSNASYDEAFAKSMADVVIEPLKVNQAASRIVKLGLNTLKKVR